MSSKTTDIAVIGLGCWYPGAQSPKELWENILSCRQSFRKFREERMPAALYHDSNPSAEDRTYGQLGAFIDGFVFDLAARRVPRSTYLSTDIAHWLALEVAAKALADAGYSEGAGLPLARTGVILGNSLTGEFTRSTSMRLRWPFLERLLKDTATAQGIPLTQVQPLINAAGERFRSHFPATNEDTLAGALSNTIAGRICGNFDFGGGGYVVDGACSSSLLAVATAASALEDRRVDACLAGGVDISMDPFELVGFAKARALTKSAMRVYDKRGNGFVPGEGCGFVVLKRLEDAEAAGDNIYAVIRGWGISSDGRNAITAPKVSGQARAIKAAWDRAGRPDFVEGHGTGTAVGDRVELEAIASVVGDIEGRPLGVTSLKSILGHTKAAAGIGAFIKAVMAVNRRIMPPTTGCQEANPVFFETAKSLYPLMRGVQCAPEQSLSAGVSAMGFGGINSHVVVSSGAKPDPRIAPALAEAAILASAQDSELFVFGEHNLSALHNRLMALRPQILEMAQAEMPDLSAQLVANLPANTAVRAAIVADTPETLLRRLDLLLQAQQADGPEIWLETRRDFARNPARIAFVCPGQGSQQLETGRVLLERDPALARSAQTLFAQAQEATGIDLADALYPRLNPLDDEGRQAAQRKLSQTAFAQPALCFGSWLWAQKLAAFGLKPTALAGHSLGEISALALAGAFAPDALITLAAKRGHLMTNSTENTANIAEQAPTAGMTSLLASAAQVEALYQGLSGYLAIANINGPSQVVVAGDIEGLTNLETKAAAAGIKAKRLPVSNGFHSLLVDDAAQALRRDTSLPKTPVALQVPVFSSVTDIHLQTALADHVADHARSPVNFDALLKRVAAEAELIVEVGAGRVLSGLAENILGSTGPRCLPVEGQAGRTADLHAVLASAWVRGAALRWQELHAGRFVRPFVAAQQLNFLVNPCESQQEFHTPTAVATPVAANNLITPATSFAAQAIRAAASVQSIVNMLIDHISQRTGFAVASIANSARLREDLNLDSIKAGEIIATCAQQLGVADRIDPAQLSNHPLEEIAHALAAAGASIETTANLSVHQPVARATLPTNMPVQASAQPVAANQIVEQLMQIVVERTGFARQSLSETQRLREDLNLDSIKAGEIIATVASTLGVADRIDPAQLSNHPLVEIAATLAAAGASQPVAVTASTISTTAPAMVQPSFTPSKPLVNATELLIDLVVERTGFDRASVHADLRLREDLNLDSIKVGEIISSAAGHLQVADRIDPAQLSNHPLSEIGAALTAAMPAVVPATPAPVSAPAPMLAPPVSTTTAASTAQPWVRSFGLRAIPAPAALATSVSGRRLQVIAAQPQTLQTLFTSAGARLDEQQPEVVILQLSGDITTRVEQLAFALTQLTPSVRSFLIIQSTDGRFGLTHTGSGCAAHAFARSISQERPQLAIGLIDVAPTMALDRVAELIPTTPGFNARGIDADGEWLLEAYPLVPATQPRRAPLAAGELVLVTGGARGITAACAAHLARATGVRLALVGSTPSQKVDDEVLRNLGQLALEGIEARYWCCDLADAKAVSDLINTIETTQGRITAVVHGAGRNQPRRAEQLSAADALTEMAPKVLGAKHVLAALADKPPRLFCAFTSIIGVSGMVGNAWYAFANETLDLELAAFQEAHPETDVLSIAYGVWDEIGMGAKLGSVSTLARMGIGALSPADGCDRFLNLMQQDPATRQVVVTANVDGLTTWPATFGQSAELRFLDGKVVGVPSVDFRITLPLSNGRDPYLADHVFGGSYLFPTVFGLEAMAQAAWAVTGGKAQFVAITDIALPAPIVVSDAGTRIEIRALVRESEPNIVDCEVRTEMTGFARAHFKASFHLGQPMAGEQSTLPTLPTLEQPLVPRDDLYGGLLFQGTRFQKMGPITHAATRKLIYSAIQDAAPHGERWLLGDPYFRDTLLQAGQVLIPLDDALPVSLAKITLFANHDIAGDRRVFASIDSSTEKSHFGSVRVVDANGKLLETIDGYEVRVLAHHPDHPDFEEILNPSEADQTRVKARLTGLCAERNLPLPTLMLHWAALHDLSQTERRQQVQRLLQESGIDVSLTWNEDGKPAGTKGERVSIAHDAQACLLLSQTAETGDVGCDIEAVRARDITLLGAELQALAAQLRAGGDRPEVAITRAWSIGEALFKAGSWGQSLSVSWRQGDAVEVSCGSHRVLSFVAALARGPRRILAFALPIAPAPAVAVAPAQHTADVQAKVNIDFIDPDSHRVGMRRGNPDRMVTRFVIPFDESGSLSGKVPSYALASWMGRLRELALTGIKESLRETLYSGLYGMVTEQAGVNLTGEAAALDVVEAHTWVEALTSGSCVLRFAFYRVNQHELEPIGTAFQRFGWVEVYGHGLIRGGVFPDFLRQFLESLHHNLPQPNVTPLLVPTSPVLGKSANATTLVESNIVGNLYFAHSFKWPNRLLDQLIWQKMPELFRARGMQGEVIISSQRVEYLREAMPFDTVEVILHLEQVSGSEFTLGVVYQRSEAKGAPTRLALGEVKGHWVVRNAEGTAISTDLPANLLNPDANDHHRASLATHH